MSNATLTSANSTLMIAVSGLYPVPQKIEGFAADDMFTSEAIEVSEIVMGADGKMSAGKIFNPTKVRIVILPDSPSFEFFNNWALATNAAREILWCNATVNAPGQGFKYGLSKGTLSRYTPFPGLKRIAQPVEYELTFESCAGAKL